MTAVRATNFAPRARRPVAAVAALLWVAALGAVVAVVWAWSEGARLRSESRQLALHLETVQQEAALLQAEAEGTPEAQALRAQAERVAFFNALSGPRARPLAGVMAALAGALSENVWLGQMTYDAETGRLALQLRSEDEGALPAALARLEALPMLRGLILERQVRLRQGNRALVQYDVTAEVAG